MFNVDFDKLLTWLLPALLRKPVFFAWVQTLCSPVKQLYDEFIAKRTTDLYVLNHDSRVFSIQAVLNDRFDNVNRTIYLTDGFAKPRIYLYTPEENKPVYLNPTIPVYNEGDYGDTGIDFIVWVPNAVAISNQDLIEMTSLVNKYKLASKRFSIYRV